MKNEKVKRKRALWGAMVGWFLMVTAVVLINGLREFGRVKVAPSISMYVGYGGWSVWGFLLSNIILVVFLLRYLVLFREDMGKIWWGLLIMIIVAFLVVSALPVGYYDDIERGIISSIHRMAAYGMFVLVMPFVVLSMKKCPEGNNLKRVGRVFLAFIGILATSFLINFIRSLKGGGLVLPWGEMMLIIEGAYIVMMLAVCLCVNMEDFSDLVGREGLEPPTLSV